MILDLFAGPGGWDEGLKALGRNDVTGIEWDAAACDTAEAAGHRRIMADVAAIAPSDFSTFGGRVDGITASPPCQGFSLAGTGRGRQDSAAIIAAVEEMGRGRDPRERLRSTVKDERSVLALEPLRWTLELEPDWVAWEQVPGVLPLWHECGITLAQNGYHVSTGMVRAEQYGVPQTRKRAILIASRYREVSLPKPTHSQYHTRKPDRLDLGVLPWVSMAEALGWGMTERPYPTVATGTARGGTDPQAVGGSGARAIIRTEHDAGRWIEQPLNHPRRDDPEYRAAVAAKATERVNNQSGTDFDMAWPADRPATTVVGRHLVVMPGANANRWNGATKSRNDGLRVTPQEAALLQSFRADYPWQGNITAQYRQVGDAVPPLMAAHVAHAAGARVTHEDIRKAA